MNGLISINDICPQSDIIADIMHWIDAHPGEDLASLIKQGEGYYKDEWEIKLTNKKGAKKNTKKNTKTKNPFLNGVCLIKDDD